MSAAHAIATQRVDVLDVFLARADARAYLWAVGEYDMPTAVDQLQADAVRDGLVDRLGQDAVQAIIAAAISRYTDSPDE